MKEEKNIPELRFPEFEGDWNPKKISEIGKFFGGGTPESNHFEYWQGSIPWISSSDICEDNIHDINITRNITENALKESATKLIPKYSVLIVSRVGIGKFAVNINELCTSQDFTNLTPLSDNSFFLAYSFTARQKRFLRLSQGTSIKGFTGEDIGNLKFHIPDLSEQQKIASFLASVDQRIHLLTQKKEKLEQYKKGIMQCIFCQELRFRDVKRMDYPEWEEKRLGDICYSIKAGKYQTSQEGAFPVYGSTGIIGYTSDFSYNGRYILAARVGANAGLLNIADGKFDVTDNTLVLDIKSTSFIDFVFFYLLNFKLNKLIFGSGQPLITGSQLKSLRIMVPIIAEQQKIASFLSSIDDKINRINTQLELTRKWKQGLLQKMFV